MKKTNAFYLVQVSSYQSFFQLRRSFIQLKAICKIIKFVLVASATQKHYAASKNITAKYAAASKRLKRGMMEIEKNLLNQFSCVF